MLSTLYTLCLLTRFAFFLGARYGNTCLRARLAWVAAGISIGFFTLYIFNLRSRGMEAPGGVIWWKSLRPIHGALYGMYAVTTLTTNYACSSYFILADVVAGLVAYIVHYQ